MKSSFSKTRTKGASATREDASQALAAYPAPLQLMGHDSKGLAQHHHYDQINSSPRAMQLYRDHPPSNVAVSLGRVHQGVVQLSRWGEWGNSLETVSAGTRSLALFGMAIVNQFRESGTNARIGGSLAAKMLGGRREPGDLDLEIPGKAEVAVDAKARFSGWIQRNLLFQEGRNLFTISAFSSPSGVLQVTYHSIVTEAVIDMEDDEFDPQPLLARLRATPGYTTSIDFSSEALFTMMDLQPTDANADLRGHYGAEYLIASYLNRLAMNSKDGAGDPKNDRGQIIALLDAMISKENEARGAILDASALAVFLESCKAKILNHVKPGNPKIEMVVGILNEICAEMQGGKKNAPSGPSEPVVDVVLQGGLLNISQDTFSAIRQMAADANLEHLSEELVASFKAHAPYLSYAEILAAMLEVIPDRKVAAQRMAEYIFDEYGQ